MSGDRFPWNDEQKKALKVLCGEEYPYLLLTGDAGTGKSTVIKECITRLRNMGKNVIVAASTGFAAAAINGTTYYEAFGLHPRDEEGENHIIIPQSLSKSDVVIIDEVSMITAEMFDLIFQELQYIYKQKGKQIKLILIGDFFQLPPVSEKGYVNMHWLFQANAFKNLHTIMLKEKVRQAGDAEFAQNLDYAKHGDERCIGYINSHCSKTKFVDGTYLCGTRSDAEMICKSKLLKLQGKEEIIPQECTRNNLLIRSREECTQLELVLMLKIGARIRFTVNDTSDGKYVNGTSGIIRAINKENGRVISLTVETQEGVIEVGRVSFPSDKDPNTQISQFPVRLSYAITIHKAQGMTFDYINIIPAGWEPGQLYVALSRAKTIGGIYLHQPITKEMLKCDPRVVMFYKSIDV